VRVEVTTIESFCEELKHDHGLVHRGIVRFRVDAVAEQDECVSFEIRVWATALVRTKEGDYVLECGVVAGTDFIGDGESKAGSERADEWRRQVLGIAESYDLTVRNGKIEVW